MNTEQLRADFEAWIASPPYERKPLGINPEASGFPGQYRAYEVQLAWEAYQAGRAALQSHPTEAFPCRIVEADFETNTVTVEMQGKYTVNAGQKYLCNAPLQLQDREYDPDTIRALLAERDALAADLEAVRLNASQSEPSDEEIEAMAALKAENEMLRETLKDADNEMDGSMRIWTRATTRSECACARTGACGER